MATLQEVLDKLDVVKAAAVAADQGVEQLYALIAQFTNDGITPVVADQLLAKLGEVEMKIGKIVTDDIIKSKMR